MKKGILKCIDTIFSSSAYLAKMYENSAQLNEIIYSTTIVNPSICVGVQQSGGNFDTGEC